MNDHAPRDARALQAELAARADALGPSHRSNGLSRAASLNLIDALSRYGASGLGLLAGLAVFGATFVGRDYPFRAAVWAVVVFSGLYVCRRFRFEYRAGKAFAGRPFRWRANYTAALSVLSAGFGAGAFILSPAAAAAGDALQTMALVGLALIVAGGLHAAHGRSAASVMLPGGAFILAAALSRFGAGPATAGLAVGAAVGAGAVFLLSRRLAARANRRFPRAVAPVRNSPLAPRRQTSTAAALDAPAGAASAAS